MSWHAKSLSEIFRELNSSRDGLTQEEAQRRLKIYGKNEIEFRKRNVLLEVLKEQLSSPFVLLLIFASILSFVIGNKVEAIVIAVTILIYIIFDALQEYKSEKIIDLLKTGMKTEAKVRRDKKLIEIPSEELVPGDIVILKAGDKVPADVRIIFSRNLYVDESILTGESKPVYKEETVLPKDTILSERRNMLFMGTYVVKGYAEGIVVATGRNTEFGRIFNRLSEEPQKKTPLEMELDRFGKVITAITITIIILAFILSIVKGLTTITDAILFSIALGVSVIPESLPTVLTTIFTIGLGRIHRKGAIVKRLDSVQTLGSVDTIFTDKTGTLTLNQLTAVRFWFNGKEYGVTGKGYEPVGDIIIGNKLANKEEIKLFAEACINSCDSELVYDEKLGWKVIGDPLEGALISLAMKAGISERYKVLNIFEFDRKRKRMSVVVEKDGKAVAFVKGAPESILTISKYIYINGKVIELSEDLKKKIEEIILKDAKRGYRLIALGYKEVDREKIEDLDEVERDIIFFGVVSMIDPIREEVPEAIKFAQRAGIAVYIITGDHPDTALSVARKIGLNTLAIEAKEIKNLSDEELYNVLKTHRVIARADPEDKYRILKVFRERGHIVAMTGDGINDALALKEADIGISFKRATDVAKEAADMILLNNSFAAIIEAIKEGRRIFYDLRAVLESLISMNLALMYNVVFNFFILSTVLFKAVQILYFNLMIETLNGIAIGDIPVKEDLLMSKPARNIVNQDFIHTILRLSLMIGLVSIFLTALYYKVGLSIPLIATLVIFYFIISRYSIFLYIYYRHKVLFFKSKLVLISLAIVLFLQAIFFFTPAGKILGFEQISFRYLLVDSAFIAITFLMAYVTAKLPKLEKKSVGT